jgi:hypothetical protein
MSGTGPEKEIVFVCSNLCLKGICLRETEKTPDTSRRNEGSFRDNPIVVRAAGVPGNLASPLHQGLIYALRKDSAWEF